MRRMPSTKISLGRNPFAERQRRQDGQLGARIVAVDVRARVGFRVTQRLRLRQHNVKRIAAPFHFRQDVIARAVQNAGDSDDPVARNAFPQHSVNRNAARHAGLHGEVDLGLNRSIPDLGAAKRHQLLVRRDNRLAVRGRAVDDLARHGGAAD